MLLSTTLFFTNIQALAVQVPEVLTGPMKEALKQSPELPSITNVVLSTIFMVVMIYAVAFIYQKLSHFNNKKFAGHDEKIFNLNKMKIINTLPLGANKAVHIVEVNGKYLVLGSTPTNINLLKEFDKNTLCNIEMSICDTEKEEIKPEDIEQGLKTIYPQEETPQKESEALAEMDYERIYKKYI